MTSAATTFDIRVPSICSLPHTGRRLPNGASIIFVEDKNNTTPAAAMSIAVGSNNDPKEFPGLAHFCEHMLFMGTEKYPSEDAYSNAVGKSGGYSNAWTGPDATTYYYTSSQGAYKELLQMFLDFFIAPAFNTSAVDREINAVHSEDEKNHAVDFWRLDEMYRSFFTEDHPRFRYGNGNLTTLKEEPAAKGLSLHSALREFFAETYVAEKSCLVLYSSFKTEELLALVEPILGTMRTGTPAPQSFLPKGTVTPLRSDALGKWYNVITTRKERRVRVSWVLPFGRDTWRSRPAAMLSHLLGHEVKGSIAAVLRERGWATSLTATASSFVDSDFAHVYVDVTLTDEGLGNMLGVVDTVFSFIEMVRREKSLTQWSFDELKLEAQTSFEFSEVGAADNYASRISNAGAQYGAEYAVTADRLIGDEADKEAMFKALCSLTADLCIVTCMAGSEEVFAAVAQHGAFVGQPKLDLKTRFHGMAYSAAPIPEEYMAKWSVDAMATAEIDPALSLPAPNPYFTTDFTVYPADDAAAEDAATKKSAVVEPTRFPMQYGYGLARRNLPHLATTPKLGVMINLLFSGNTGPSGAFYRGALKNVLAEACIDTTYYAELAAIDFSTGAGAIGLVLTFDGPSATVPSFAVDTLAKMLKADFMKQSEVMYVRNAKKYLTSLESTKEGQPYSLASEDMNALYAAETGAPVWHKTLAFGRTATYQGYCDYVDASLKSIRVEVVVDGNLKSVEDAKSLVMDRVDAVLASSGAAPAPVEAIPTYRDFYVPKSAPTANSPAANPAAVSLVRVPAYSPSNTNAAAVMRVYVGEATPRAFATAKVLSNLMASHFFGTLRTTEALGYIVGSGASEQVSRQVYFYFIAQSALAGPMYLFSRMHAFLDAYREQTLAKLTQSDVDDAVNGYVNTLKAPTTSVRADCARIFADRLCPHGWDYREQQVAFLESTPLTPQCLAAMFDAHMANSSPDRRASVAFIDSDKIKETFLLNNGTEDNDIAVIQMPAMLKGDDAAAEAEEEKKGGDGDGAAVVDSKLIMNTFEGAPVFVGFRPIKSAADVAATSELVKVPMQ